ncbi:cystine/glutamate transporter-like [Apostichopus japonicus]|uniref:cystine/glutamate transporter-like n=1 Tax=Stichopus japonicus TaxID=307972 RepID=UPI003AB61954
MADAVVLKKHLNFWDCCALIVGTIIGAGIFVSPKGVLLNTGSLGWALIVWVVCGAYSTLGALCYAELGTSIRKSGGDYTFIMDSAGPLFAFLNVWTTFTCINTAGMAILSLTAANYMLAPIFSDCENGVPFIITRLLACCILGAVTFVNCMNLYATRKVTIIFTLAKSIGLGIIVISGIFLILQGNVKNFQEDLNLGDADWGKFPFAFYTGLYAYAGWNNLPNVTEEIKQPSREIPSSIIASMFFVTVVYTLTNIAYFAVLTPDEILASDAVAVSYANRVLGESVSLIIPITVAFSCIGTSNGLFFSSSRVIHVASRDGQLPGIMSMIHPRYKTPIPATAVMLPICCLMLTTDSVDTLITYLSFTRWTFFAMATASIPYFRWKYPDAERPFKVPLIVPFLFVAMAIFMVAGSIYSAPGKFVVGVIITLVGIPVWIIFVWCDKRPECIRRAEIRCTVFLQKLFYVVREETEALH